MQLELTDEKNAQITLDVRVLGYLWTDNCSLYSLSFDFNLVHI